MLAAAPAGPKPPDMGEQKRKLQALRTGASPKQQALIDRELALLAEAEALQGLTGAARRETIRRLYGERVDLMRAFAAAYPDDAKTQCSLAASL